MPELDAVEYLLEALAEQEQAHHQAIGALTVILRNLAAAASSAQRVLEALADANEYTAAHIEPLGIAAR